MPGFDVILPSEAAAELWALLMEAGTEAGILPMGEETWEALRVEAGVPRWGAELSERYNPLEANLLESISWDKGCYIGQEVVARLNTYHKVQRYLVGLAFDGGGSLTPGATLTVDGTPAGALTSVAYSPGAGRWLGMGYLRTQYVKQHAEVVATTEDGGAVRGTVIPRAGAAGGGAVRGSSPGHDERRRGRRGLGLPKIGTSGGRFAIGRFRKRTLGRGGFEPPTSALSELRSNRLSYRPMGGMKPVAGRCGAVSRAAV